MEKLTVECLLQRIDRFLNSRSSNSRGGEQRREQGSVQNVRLIVTDANINEPQTSGSRRFYKTEYLTDPSYSSTSWVIVDFWM